MCGLVERRMRRSNDAPHAVRLGSRMRDPAGGACATSTADIPPMLLNDIFRRARRVWELPVNPVVEVERLTTPKRSGIEFYSPEEVHALMRCASSTQDRVLFLTAALTGLRMGELLALRRRDIDFEAQTIRVLASYTAWHTEVGAGEGGTVGGGDRAGPCEVGHAQALERAGQSRVRRRGWGVSGQLGPAPTFQALS